MITNPIAFVYYIANGTSTDFAYSFNGADGFDTKVPEEVKAAIRNPDGTTILNPNFAVLMDTYNNLTGAVRFAEAPVANAIIYLYRQTPQTQDKEFKTSSGFSAETIGKSLDKLTQEVQEVNDQARNKTLQLNLFQETPIDLQRMTDEDQGGYLWMDFANKLVKAGLRFEIVNQTDEDAGNLRVSKDGALWIDLPKSSDIKEFRQVILNNPTRYILQYRVGTTWYSLGGDGLPLILRHNELEGREEEDGHPIVAITELPEKLEALESIFVSYKPRLTGVVTGTVSGDITEMPDHLGLNIPAMQILFNKDVYYANANTEFQVLEVSAFQALLGDMGSGTQKTFYTYILTDGTVVNNESIPSGDQGADRCYLGSGFTVKVGSEWQIQANSWKTQPWIPEASMELRTDPLNHTSNVVWSPFGPLEMTLRAFKITGEGFNYIADPNNPNLFVVAEKEPCPFKRIYPGYTALESDITSFGSLDVWYNKDTGLIESVPVGRFSVVVPFCTPTGQILLLLQQGTTANPGHFPADLATITGSMPNLEYDFTNISSRIMPLGMCWAVYSTITDVSDDLQLFTMQDIPAQLKQYGVSGGGSASPSMTGATAFNSGGDQIGGTGTIREFQAGKNVEFSVVGQRLTVDAIDSNIQKIGATITLVASNTIELGSDNFIQPIIASGSLAAASITLDFTTAGVDRAPNYELHIFVGSVIPVLTWTDSISWINESSKQIIDSNKTSVFIFRNQNGTIIGSYAGSY